MKETGAEILAESHPESRGGSACALASVLGSTYEHVVISVLCAIIPLHLLPAC